MPDGLYQARYSASGSRGRLWRGMPSVFRNSLNLQDDREDQEILVKHLRETPGSDFEHMPRSNFSPVSRHPEDLTLQPKISDFLTS